MGRKRHSKKVGINTNQTETGKIESDLFICDISPIFGRFLKSKVDIKKGDLILKEKCLIAGPHLTSKPICIGCHSELPKIPSILRCAKCQWNICNLKCENSAFHKIECQFFTERKIRPKPELNNCDFGAITVIRALLLKIYEPVKWKQLISLEHHNSIRQTLPEWKTSELYVNLIREKWNLSNLFTEEEIFSVCGILEVNSFEMGDCFSFGGIFPIAAMISHDCIPNSSQSEIIEEVSLEIKAVVDIPAGSPITLCYESCLKGTAIRQRQLRKSKYFDCSCARCKDPTELGTHLSTLICTNCKKGFVTKDSDLGWICNKCSQKLEDESVELTLQKYTKFSEALPNIVTQEEFLTACKTVLHPNHFIPFGVKYSLCLAYGHDEGYSISELTQSESQRKLDLCSEILKVLEVLTPGNNVVRGNVLYEYQAAQVLVSKNLLESGKCSKGLIKRRLQNTLKMLVEAIVIFKSNYSTRLLGESAENTTVKELKSWINSLN